MSLVYELIAKMDRIVLTEYTSAGGNFQMISRQILERAALSRRQRITSGE